MVFFSRFLGWPILHALRSVRTGGAQSLRLSAVPDDGSSDVHQRRTALSWPHRSRRFRTSHCSRDAPESAGLHAAR